MRTFLLRILLFTSYGFCLQPAVRPLKGERSFLTALLWDYGDATGSAAARYAKGWQTTVLVRTPGAVFRNGEPLLVLPPIGEGSSETRCRCTHGHRLFTIVNSMYLGRLYDNR